MRSASALSRLLLLLLLLLLSGGCWNRIEINDLAIITEVGLDRAGNGQLLLSVNLVVPARVGTPGGAGGKGQEGNPVLTFSEHGVDVMQAISRLQLKVPRKLFWGHMRVLVLGERFARSGVRQGIDFWTRHRQPRLTAQVVVVPGEAHTFLKAQPALRRLPSEALREVIEAKTGLEVTVKDFLAALSSHGQDPVAPRFELVASEALEPRGAEVQMTGVALFRDDRLVGWLETGQMRGLIWLRGEPHFGTLTLVLDERGSVSMELIRSRAELHARLERGRPVVDMLVEAETDVAENTTNLDLSRLEVLYGLETLLSKELKERISGVFDLLTKEYRVDSFGISELLRRSAPKEWARVRMKWRERLTEAKLNVQFKVYIRRTGKHGPPLGFPEERLEKL